jgi:DNA-binding transcriptional MerR regulator
MGITTNGTYLTSSQTARRLAVSHTTVRTFTQRGILTPVSTPLGNLYDPAEVERLARERGETAEEA